MWVAQYRGNLSASSFVSNSLVSCHLLVFVIIFAMPYFTGTIEKPFCIMANNKIHCDRLNGFSMLSVHGRSINAMDDASMKNVINRFAGDPRKILLKLYN